MNSPKFDKVFGVINYDSEEVIDQFITNLTKEQAFYCLQEAVKCGVKRGAFSLIENELISKALRTINLPRKNNEENNLENPNNSSNLEI